MFFILSKVLSFLINPIVWIVTALLMALFLKKPQWKRRSLLLGLGLLLFFTNRPICNLVLSHWEAQTITVEDIKEPFDIGILLGGASENYATRPNADYLFYLNFSANRITQAIELYKLGKIKKLLLSGGSGNILKEKTEESKETKLFLMRLGIPEEDILIEGASRNTYENALFSKNLLTSLGQADSSSLLLLTSAFHIPRASKCFDKVGLQVTPFSVDIQAYPRAMSLDDLVPDTGAITVWKVTIREWIGIIVYRLKGYI